MFNDRDLGILGAGAFLAVLSLFLPLPFVGKMVLGFLILVGFMAVALLRLGPDRIPPEVWLMRRLRYARQTRYYVNQQKPSGKKQSKEKKHWERPGLGLHPLDLAWDEIGIYPLLTALLGVLGIYFLVWLKQGGVDELAVWFQ